MTMRMDGCGSIDDGPLLWKFTAFGAPRICFRCECFHSFDERWFSSRPRELNARKLHQFFVVAFHCIRKISTKLHHSLAFSSATETLWVRRKYNFAQDKLSMPDFYSNLCISIDCKSDFLVVCLYAKRKPERASTLTDTKERTKNTLSRSAAAKENLCQFVKLLALSAVRWYGIDGFFVEPYANADDAVPFNV